MDYRWHHDRLIERARNRAFQDGMEEHHIIPRCMGGNDESINLVRLTPEEHYIAHQLLVKMYPNVVGLAFAAQMMAMNRTGNKLYGWIRRRTAEHMRANNPNQGGKARREYIAKHNHPPKRRPYSLTDQQRNGYSIRMKTNNPNADGSCRKKPIQLIPVEVGSVLEFDSLKAAAVELNLETGKIMNITSIIRNMKLNKPYKGFYWQYI